MELVLRLKSLELRNFHRFEKFSIDFDDHMTVLVGNNGSGKSSLLSAAAVAVGTLFIKFDNIPTRSILRSDARVKTFDYGETIDLQEQYPVEVTARGFVAPTDSGDIPQNVQTGTWTRRLTTSKGKTTYGDAGFMVHWSDEIAQRVQGGDTDFVLPVVSYYGTGRLWAKKRRKSERKQRFSRLDGYRDALDAETNEDQMLSWFFKMAVQDAQRAQGLSPDGRSALYAAVRRAVAQCFARITKKEPVEVSYNFDTDDIEVKYLDGEGGVRRMPMGLLSDGYRTTLSMIADIAYRMALLNPMLGERVLESPGVVLIDEVDLHLHPLWQAQILGDLRSIFPNVQFIVTTHAPIVVSSVRSEHVRVLSGGEGGMSESAELPPDQTYGSDVGRTLESVMGAPERPEEVQRKFDEFYDKLDQLSRMEQPDFAVAEKMLDDLERGIGPNDTDLVAARTALELEIVDCL